MKDAYLAKAKKSPLLVSDVSFVNLFGWDSLRHYRLSRLNENIVIKATYGSHEAFLPPIGSFRLQETLARLLEDTGLLIHMTRRHVRRLRHHAVKATFDRDNADYLFLHDTLVHLPGKAFINRRRLYNYFTRTYGPVYRPLTPGLIRYVRSFEEQWYENNRERINDPHLHAEHEAALAVLDNYNRFDLLGGVIMIQDEIKGYIIGEELNPLTLLTHFEKCDLNYRGMFPALFLHFCSQHPYKYVNMMQDLGVKNLRHAKLLYRPDYFLKKYIITKKP